MGLPTCMKLAGEAQPLGQRWFSGTGQAHVGALSPSRSGDGFGSPRLAAWLSGRAILTSGLVIQLQWMGPAASCP